MKIVFVGPSLPDAGSLVDEGTQVWPPAVQGDVLRAVRAGARVIGLIDGGFEYTAPVWHKEILYALSRGVVVLGAASMGALRAAECRSFGMIGVGRIFDGYAAGELLDDSDVALIHAPQELGYEPLTIPMVNVRATVDALQADQSLTGLQSEEIINAAGRVFFKERTWRSICLEWLGADHRQAQHWETLLRSKAVDQKRYDAIALLERMKVSMPQAAEHPWEFNQISLWREG
jgi:hypothetical protein